MFWYSSEILWSLLFLTYLSPWRCGRYFTVLSTLCLCCAMLLQPWQACLPFFFALWHIWLLLMTICVLVKEPACLNFNDRFLILLVVPGIKVLTLRNNNVYGVTSLIALIDGRLLKYLWPIQTVLGIAKVLHLCLGPLLLLELGSLECSMVLGWGWSLDCVFVWHLIHSQHASYALLNILLLPLSRLELGSFDWRESTYFVLV